MAIWQYVAYLISAASIGPDGTVPGMTADDDFELPPLSLPMSAEEFERLADDYLPPVKAKGDSYRTWGDDAKDDLSLFTEHDKVVELRVRLDLRDVTMEKVRKLLRFAQAIQCCFVEGRDTEIFEATENALVNSIRTSRSAAFVSNPREFLERLSQESTDKSSA